jgi:glycosidase
MEGAGDPDNRKFMRFGAQLNGEQQATLAHVRALASARHAHRAFRAGSRTQLLMDGDGLVWAYGLSAGADRAVVVFNRRPDAQTRSVPVGALGLPDGATLHEVLRGAQVPVSNQAVSVSIPGKNSAVLVLE